MSTRILVVTFTLLLGATIPQAMADIIIPDGVLANDPDSSGVSGGVSITQSISPSFDIADAPFAFSGTLDPSNASANGDYGIGMTIGDLWFFFHPGFSNGAFRIQSDSLIEVSNQDMGFAPTDAPVDFSIILSDAGSGNFGADVTITQGSNAYTPGTFVLAASKFGAGGSIDSFGVQHNRFLAAAPSPTTLAYSGVTASMAVPEPSTLSIFALGVAGLLLPRRRTQR